MVQGQVLGEGGLVLFLSNFFKVYHFYIWKLLYLLQNCVMHLKKIIFFCHHNFMKKCHSKLSENKPENVPQIKITYQQRDLKDSKLIFDRMRQLNWLNHFFDICLNQGMLVGWINGGGGCVRVGSCVKYHKRGETKKRGGETKNLKKGGGGASWVNG